MEKRNFKIQLHTQIVIGLILGALFGSYFHIDQNKIEINSKAGTIETSNWNEFQFLKKDSVIKSFTGSDQLQIIKYSNSIKDKKDLNVRVKNSETDVQNFEEVKNVSKVRTIGVMLKPVGDIFIRLLNMIAVPLVLASLIVGAASLSDLKHIAKIGGKTIGFYGLTAVMAIGIGLAFC